MTLTDAQIDLIAERVAARLREASAPKTYTAKEAAAILGLHEKTIKSLVKRRILNSIPGTAKVIIPAAEIERLCHVQS